MDVVDSPDFPHHFRVAADGPLPQGAARAALDGPCSDRETRRPIFTCPFCAMRLLGPPRALVARRNTRDWIIPLTCCVPRLVNMTGPEARYPPVYTPPLHFLTVRLYTCRPLESDDGPVEVWMPTHITTAER